jgi:hypothetical protein
MGLDFPWVSEIGPSACAIHYERIKMKISLTTIGVAAVTVTLGLALAPSAFAATASAPTGGPGITHTECVTYDSTIAAGSVIDDPSVEYIALGPNSTPVEHVMGHAGPIAQASVDAAVAKLEELKAASIARGDECVGVSRTFTD